MKRLMNRFSTMGLTLLAALGGPSPEAESDSTVERGEPVTSHEP